MLRRDGTSDLPHRLYVSTCFLQTSSEIMHAVGLAKPLQRSGLSRDDQHCYRRNNCTPFEMFAARIPAALLRLYCESMAVNFYARSGSELLVTVHCDLIQLYHVDFDFMSAIRQMN